MNKPDLIKLVLQLESEMNSEIKVLTSEIRDLVTQIKKVEVGVAIFKNVNQKLVNQPTETKWKCWANVQYARRECLQVVGIPVSIPDDLLEGNICKVFGKCGVHVEGKDIQACHCLKDTAGLLSNLATGKTVFKFFMSRKTSNLWI